MPIAVPARNAVKEFVGRLRLMRNGAAACDRSSERFRPAHRPDDGASVDSMVIAGASPLSRMSRRVAPHLCHVVRSERSSKDGPGQARPNLSGWDGEAMAWPKAKALTMQNKNTGNSYLLLGLASFFCGLCRRRLGGCAGIQG